MDNEKIQNFADMVNATDKLAKPWRWALAITNILWAIVFTSFILLAYLTPDSSYQYQELPSQVQEQSMGSEIVTKGK